MLIDIDVPAGSQVVHVTRPDGCSTVSVPQHAFQKAVEVYAGRLDSIRRTFAADELLADINKDRVSA